ncbi:hypothetical protein HMI54_015611 [Coelomomyces lativittatus]|nr:hypothetical protein HMI56_001652 [Coelomomyces lativittatus]KAJ1512616.1 hypothetical protein HMI54_015611 [Coelomomyces lativittatus]
MEPKGGLIFRKKASSLHQKDSSSSLSSSSSNEDTKKSKFGLDTLAKRKREKEKESHPHSSFRTSFNDDLEESQSSNFQRPFVKNLSKKRTIFESSSASISSLPLDSGGLVLRKGKIQRHVMEMIIKNPSFKIHSQIPR